MKRTTVGLLAKKQDTKKNPVETSDLKHPAAEIRALLTGLSGGQEKAEERASAQRRGQWKELHLRKREKTEPQRPRRETAGLTPRCWSCRRTEEGGPQRITEEVRMETSKLTRRQEP